MNYLDIFLFAAKYTPFWAVPMAVISFNFGYLYWLKDFKEIAYGWMGVSILCFIFTILYFVLGGPDQIVQSFIHVFV